jgi:hypothetical protein
VAAAASAARVSVDVRDIGFSISPALKLAGMAASNVKAVTLVRPGGTDGRSRNRSENF